MKALTFGKDEVIFREGDKGDTMFEILSGTVGVYSAFGTEEQQEITRLTSGQMFGEMAILDNSPRSATCIAKGNVKCLEFNKENFKVLITGNPQIAMILLKLFCKRIYDQHRRFRILVIKDMQARIADVFLMCDDMLAPEERGTDGSNRRKFFLTIGDVAHWAGISVDEARDELSKFSAKHKIDMFDDFMIVQNIQEMKRIVDTYFSTHEKRSLKSS